jgi:hypothetical protein
MYNRNDVSLFPDYSQMGKTFVNRRYITEIRGPDTVPHTAYHVAVVQKGGQGFSVNMPDRFLARRCPGKSARNKNTNYRNKRKDEFTS